MVHQVEEFRSAISVTARCTCGWSHQETRRQNALARAAKLRGATTRHFKEVAAQAQAADKIRAMLKLVEWEK